MWCCSIDYTRSRSSPRKIILVLNFPLRGNNFPRKEYSTSFPIKLYVSGFMTTVLAIIWYLKTQRTVPIDQSIISAFFSGGVGWSNFIRLKFSSRDCICGGGGYAGKSISYNTRTIKTIMLEKSIHLFTGFEWNSSLFEPRQELFPKGLPEGNSFC